jgi:TRAP transporter TAXI family solute receptor
MRGAGRRIGAAILAVVAMLGLGGCSTRAAEWTDQTYAIAGGSPTGVYYDYGGRIGAALSGALDITVQVEQTAGSLDNLRRVGSGQALLGFAQADAAADAVMGTGAFDQPLPVVAVARLYDEYLHVVVRGESDIDSIADLAGSTISLGARDSGVNVIATRVLDSAGVGIDTIQDPQLGLSDSISAMRSGEIDGFFWVGGLPTPGIEELASNQPVRLLPIERTWVTTINERYANAYRTADLPVGTYGLTQSAPTMAVPNYLVTASSTPDAVVRDILVTLFDARQEMAAEVPAAALLDRRQAVFTSPVELHPGAVDFYRGMRE